MLNHNLLDKIGKTASNMGWTQAMKTKTFIAAAFEALPFQAGSAACVVRNDNDSNPKPGWDRRVCRN